MDRPLPATITLLRQSGVNPVVVHGGGPQIGKMLQRLNIVSEFQGRTAGNRQGYGRSSGNGSCRINQQGKLSQLINADRRPSGRPLRQRRQHDHGQETATYHRGPQTAISESVVDLGFVGEPAELNPTVLKLVLKEDIIPVVAPVAPGDDGETYNINADTAAGAVAGSLNAKRFAVLDRCAWRPWTRKAT